MIKLILVLLYIGFIRKRDKKAVSNKRYTTNLDILDQSKELEEFLEHRKLQMYAHQVLFTQMALFLYQSGNASDFALVHTDIGSNCGVR